MANFTNKNIDGSLVSLGYSAVICESRPCSTEANFIQVNTNSYDKKQESQIEGSLESFLNNPTDSYYKLIGNGTY